MEPAPLSTFAIATGLLGGIGLFLLGIHMLTEGLKLAAGRALESLLERGTSTAARGLAAGVLITALVQSSTAVTVTSIGFVNTGLLTLQNALWVVFGSNLGSTMNVWLVTALGFGFRIDAFALPFVGIGVALMLGGPTLRSRSLGRALTGFGLLFLGLDELKSTFAAVGTGLDLGQYISPGVGGWLVLAAIGAALTVLMQASSAVVAIIITAAHGGLLSTEAACAMVIGTNVGTTSTAILAAIGATSNARRLAAAHVLFNVVTGIVAFLLLPALIALLDALRAWLEQPESPALTIAMFHTVFNVLGVLLMVPIGPPMQRFLAARFVSREEEAARPRHLDANSASVPDLALRALRMELGRTQALTASALASAVAHPVDAEAVTRHGATLEALAGAIGGYSSRITATSLPPALVDTLARSLRALQYQQNASAAALQTTTLGAELGTIADPDIGPALAAFRAAAGALAASADPLAPDFHAAAAEVRLEEAEAAYARLKEALLTAGAHARLDIRRMQDWLRLASLLRRAVEQTAKAARTLAGLDAGESASTDDSPAHEPD